MKLRANQNCQGINMTNNFENTPDNRLCPVEGNLIHCVKNSDYHYIFNFNYYFFFTSKKQPKQNFLTSVY